MAMNKDRRKQLREQYKQRPMTGGVYRIRNTENGRFLMSWDEDLNQAENRHNFGVTTNRGADDAFLPPIYRADWKEYGGESFVFERLEELEKQPEQTREEYYSDLETLFEMWKEKVDWTKSYKK